MHDSAVSFTAPFSSSSFGIKSASRPFHPNLELIPGVVVDVFLVGGGMELFSRIVKGEKKSPPLFAKLRERERWEWPTKVPLSLWHRHNTRGWEKS